MNSLGRVALRKLAPSPILAFLANILGSKCVLVICSVNEERLTSGLT